MSNKIQLTYNRPFLFPSGIYCIKNIFTGKVYIGSTQCFAKRMKKHFSNLACSYHHNKHLQNAFNNQKGKGFVFGVVEDCHIIDLEKKEEYWILMFKANNSDFGYNSRLLCSSNRGYKQSQEVKNAMSKRMKERVVSDETRKRMSQSSTGRKLSETTKDKLRKENLPPDRILKMSLAKKGKPAHNRLFTYIQILEIKKDTLPSRAMASKYKVSKTTILNIRKGAIYAS